MKLQDSDKRKMREDLDILIEKKKIIKSLQFWNLDELEAWTEKNLLCFIEAFFKPEGKKVILSLESGSLDDKKVLFFELVSEGVYWKTKYYESTGGLFFEPRDYSAQLFFSYLQSSLLEMFNLKIIEEGTWATDFNREVLDLARD